MTKWVCQYCEVPVKLAGKGAGTYWKHVTGVFSATKMCGRVPVPIRAAEASMSPAMRSALAEVRRNIQQDGMPLDCAIADVMQRRGFMRHELKKAYELAEAD